MEKHFEEFSQLEQQRGLREAQQTENLLLICHAYRRGVAELLVRIPLSRLRNQVLANLLRDIPGYMERLGSGIKLMIRETRQMGLPPPKFREMSEVIVTFRKAPISNASQPKGVLPKEQDVQPTLFGDLPVFSDTIVSGREEQREQERRKMLAMRYVQERGTITNREYRDLTGVSENTALRDLEELVEKGVLKITGSCMTQKVGSVEDSNLHDLAVRRF